MGGDRDHAVLAVAETIAQRLRAGVNVFLHGGVSNAVLRVSIVLLKLLDGAGKLSIVCAVKIAIVEFERRKRLLEGNDRARAGSILPLPKGHASAGGGVRRIEGDECVRVRKAGRLGVGSFLEGLHRRESSLIIDAGGGACHVAEGNQGLLQRAQVVAADDIRAVIGHSLGCGFDAYVLAHDIAISFAKEYIRPLPILGEHGKVRAFSKLVECGGGGRGSLAQP